MALDNEHLKYRICPYGSLNIYISYKQFLIWCLNKPGIYLYLGTKAINRKKALLGTYQERYQEYVQFYAWGDH